ncbi:hypothetical protein BVX98_05300 [bacterium F11]|nr:hypothetical protein BVX98_05300 [bacterium F11]
MGSLFAFITVLAMLGKDGPLTHAKFPYQATVWQSHNFAGGYQKLAGPLDLDFKDPVHYWKETGVHQIKGAPYKNMKLGGSKDE